MTRPSTAAGTFAAQPPQRIGSSPGSGCISGNSRVAPHPAAVDPVLQLPQPRAIRDKRSARRDGLLVPGADQRQRALLRHGAPQPAAGEGAAQIGGERRTLADGVNPRLLARMGEHRRDVAGREDPRVSGRAQPVVDRDEALRRQRQTGVGEPGRGTGLGHPQRLVEFDPPAIGAEQNTRRDTHDGAAGEHGHPVIGEDLLEQPADPGIVRRQQRLAGDQGYLDRVALQSGQAVLRRKRELDPAGAAADHGEAQPRHLARPRQQRLPAHREPVDRLDRDRVLGGAGDIVGARAPSRYRSTEHRTGSADGHRTTMRNRPCRARSLRRGSAARRQIARAGRDRYGIRRVNSARRRSPAACPNRASRRRG